MQLMILSAQKISISNIFGDIFYEHTYGLYVVITTKPKYGRYDTRNSPLQRVHIHRQLQRENASQITRF